MNRSYQASGSYTQSACKGCGGMGGDPRCVCKGRGYFNNPSRVYRRVDAQVADARRTLGFMSKPDVQSETEATLAKLRAK